MVLLPAASKATESMAIIRMQMSEACRKAPMPQAKLSICEADLPRLATWYDIISVFRICYGLYMLIYLITMVHPLYFAETLDKT